jgi:hypothetical protein
MPDKKKKQALWDACEAYIEKQQISCPETIGQCDWVIESAPDFIQQICDIVGYVKIDDGV